MSENNKIGVTEANEGSTWDHYVRAHHNGTHYHLFGWRDIIEKAYGHKTYYLIAFKETTTISSNPNKSKSLSNFTVAGVLPLVHIRHFLFGNSLISIPYCDYGGILADDEQAEEALLNEGIQLAKNIGAENIELRNLKPIKTIHNYGFAQSKNKINFAKSIDSINGVTRTHKYRMLMELPESSEILLKTFKSKLRSQIKKPIKDGLYSKIGGIELLDDFYDVFAINMRDLGSPVHSRKIMHFVLKEFSEESRIVMVYKNNTPLACSLIIGFKETMENPWASSIRAYSKLNPNMLLYWSMLEYAIENNYDSFDFGRCSFGSGTYKFKEQWGSEATPLYWQFISLGRKRINEPISENSKFGKASQFWKKLPVSVTKVIGPMIRKHIGL